MDAQNTYQIFDGLWTSGQPSPADIDKFSELGIDAVINLAPPNSSNALSGEAELISGKHISYIQIPVPWDNPSLQQLFLFFDILDALKNKKVWVHCAMNMRVSAFIYLYRTLRLHEDKQSASFPLTAIWEPNDTWQTFIKDAENT